MVSVGKEYYEGKGIKEEYSYCCGIEKGGENVLIEEKDFGVV